MIAYIKGAVTFKSPTFIVIETGGVGYGINISLHTYAQIEKDEHLKLLTYLHIKEDSHTLYGFNEESERNLFKQLISVSGIGTATAQLLLSSMTPDDARSAIIGENVSAFNQVKGIGPKTAKRIILDLKDKVMKDSGEVAITFKPQDNTMRNEALSALVALGFNKVHVQKALNKVIKQQSDVTGVETLIKLALKELSS